MATPSLYSDGAITVTNGSTAFTGTGTAWSTQLKAGSLVKIGNDSAYVASITNDGAGVFAESWPGDSAADSAYLAVTWNDGRDVLEVFRTLMTQLNGGGVFKSVNGVPLAGDHRENEFIRNRLSNVLYTKDQGVITPITAPFGEAVGIWAGGTSRFALSLSGSPAEVAIDFDDGTADADGVLHFSLAVDGDAEMQLPANAAEGDVYDILFTQDGTGSHTISFASGITSAAVRTAADSRTRIRFTVTAVGGSPEEATAATGEIVSYDQNQIVSDRGGLYLSTKDDNEAEPEVDGSGDPKDSADESWLVIPPGEPGEGIQIDATGTFSERTDYDDEEDGFVFASTDGDGDTITASVLFRKESNASADWSDAITFQGPAGNDGADGEDLTVIVEMMPFGAAENVAIGDGAGGIFWRAPAAANGYTLDAVAAAHVTAGTGAGSDTTDIQIHNVTQAADMLSTKLTIDEDETDSLSAATAAIIDTAEDDLATGDLLRIDIDAVVSGTAPKGLIVSMTFRKPAP